MDHRDQGARGRPADDHADVRGGGRHAARATNPARVPAESEEIEQEIVSVVEEGVKEGVVDEQEMEMIESVIEFRDTTVGSDHDGAAGDRCDLEIKASLDRSKAHGRRERS